MMELFTFLSSYATNSLVLVLLALLSAALEFHEKKYEKMAPKIFLATVYLLIFLTPEMEEILRRYLVRWSLWLLLVIEIVSYIVRKSHNRWRRRP